jgi:integrase
VLHVKRSVWHCREQAPKTFNAVRIVDIPEQLAAVLREYVTGRHGLLFATRDGKPLSHRNVHRAFHAAGAVCGFHALRRFRAEILRGEGVPEHFVRLWLGHSARNLTDLYADGLKKNQALRQEWAERAGLGFTFGLRRVTDSVSVETEKAA